MLWATAVSSGEPAFRKSATALYARACTASALREFSKKPPSLLAASTMALETASMTCRGSWVPAGLSMNTRGLS